MSRKGHLRVEGAESAEARAAENREERAAETGAEKE
jgi:hypothetical protein